MDMMKFLRERRTYRRFAPQPVAADAIADMMEAARIASCSANDCKLRYVVVKTPAAVAQCFPHVRWAGYLPPELGVPKEGEKPTLFIAVIQAKPGGQADTDAGLAISNIMDAGWAHGVGCCIMAAIDREALAPIVGLKQGERLHTMLAMGYPSHKSTIVEMEDGNWKYYLDEFGNYCVPKPALKDILTTL